MTIYSWWGGGSVTIGGEGGKKSLIYRNVFYERPSTLITFIIEDYKILTNSSHKRQKHWGTNQITLIKLIGHIIKLIRQKGFDIRKFGKPVAEWLGGDR